MLLTPLRRFLVNSGKIPPAGCGTGAGDGHEAACCTVYSLQIKSRDPEDRWSEAVGLSQEKLFWREL